MGRRAQLNASGRLLKEHRILTLVGPGGVGKSRLAIEIARQALRQSPDGVWLVDLADISDPAMVPAAVATAVGIVEGPLRPIELALEQILTDRSMVILLDNCEHIIDPCARLAEILARGCPSVRIISTSREALSIDGEHLLTVQPLSTLREGSVDARRVRATDAAQLFSDRARAVVEDFEITEALAPAVDSICRRLDGIPLALELAAARLRTMTVAEIAAGLDDRFRLLTTGRRTAPARHQTLLGMVEWSTSLLDERQQLLLRRLAVFSGGWTRESAQVCAAGLLASEDIDSALDALVDRSLVVLDDWHGTARYRLLETIRAYALDKLASSGELAVMRRAHQQWIKGQLQQSLAHIVDDQLGWFRWMDAEIDNIRTAMDWCEEDPVTADDMLYVSDAFCMFADARGMQRETVTRLGKLLALLPPGTASAGRLVGEMSYLHPLGTLGDLAGAIECIKRTRPWAPNVEDGRAQFWYDVMEWQFTLVTATEGGAELCKRQIDRGPRDETGSAEPGLWWLYMGQTLSVEGRTDEAREALVTAIQVLPVVRERGHALRALAVIDFHEGNVAATGSGLRESLRCFTEFPDMRACAVNVEALACVAAKLERWERAARLFGASEMLFDVISTINLPVWQLGPDEAKEKCLVQLGEGAFSTLLGEGRAMSVDRCFQYALESDDAPEGAPVTSALTRRELDIARAVARGLSNRQIAETLVISERTVDTHLSHVFGKLGLRSRTSLALWINENHGT